MEPQTTTQTWTAKNIMYWVGWALSVLPCLLLCFSASLKLLQLEAFVKDFKDKGYPDGVLLPIGVAEITSTILYLIPQTSVLGAVLLTGYLGGAVNHHVHLND